MLGEPGGGRPRWLIPAILAGVLVAALGLSLLLQSSGVIYSRLLARMVGGLPRQAGKALPVIRDATLNAGAFEYEAVMTTGFTDKLPEINAGTPPTITAEATLNLKGQADVNKIYSNFETEIASSYLPSYSFLKGQYAKDNSTVRVFLDLILATNNPWREMKSTAFESKAAAIPFASLELTSLLDKVDANGILIGRSSVPATTGTADANAGTTALVYQYPLKTLVDSQDAKVKESRLTLWINKKGGQVMLYQTDALLETPNGGLIITTQVRPTSYGGVTVKGAPAEAEVVTGDLGDYYPLLGLTGSTISPTTEPTSPTEPTTPTEPTNPTEPTQPTTPTPPTTNDLTTAAGRDAQRTADLQSLKQALNAYKQARGSYPVSPTVEKTNASTILSGALVPTYRSTLPVDPNNNQYWYGYTADGFSFTLTSVLEDPASPGKQGSNVRYQEVTN